jgi:hypothetical protein
MERAVIFYAGKTTAENLPDVLQAKQTRWNRQKNVMQAFLMELEELIFRTWRSR